MSCRCQRWCAGRQRACSPFPGGATCLHCLHTNQSNKQDIILDRKIINSRTCIFSKDDQNKIMWACLKPGHQDINHPSMSLASFSLAPIVGRHCPCEPLPGSDCPGKSFPGCDRPRQPFPGEHLATGARCAEHLFNNSHQIQLLEYQMVRAL